MLWLVLKSYEVIFKRFLVFSQSDAPGLIIPVAQNVKRVKWK